MNKSGYAVCMLTLWLSAFAQAAPPEARLPESHLDLFETYCFECHDSVIEEGEVNLETISFDIGEDMETAETWQKVLNSLNSGEMPPEDEPQIPNLEKTAFLDDLSNQLVVARKIFSDSGGKITMRRLNRREYQNTIEQLTGVTVDARSLPADGGSGTFDTVGASQYISSDQFEQYLKLGREAIDEAFERQAAQKEGPGIFRVEPETTVNVQSLKDMRDLEEIRKRFLLWKAGVDKAAAAPENREIMARILKANPTIDPSAFPEKPGRDFYLHAQELIGVPDPKKFGFTDDNKAVFSFQGSYVRKHPLLKHYAELPHSDRGTYLKTAWGIQRIDVSPDPKTLPPGTYTLRVRAGAVPGSPSSRHFIEIGHPQRVNGVPAGFASLPISGHQVTGTIEQPEIIETQVKIGLHTQREFGIQERQPTDRKAARDSHNQHKRVNGYGVPPAIWIDWIELEGPINPSNATQTWKQRRVAVDESFDRRANAERQATIYRLEPETVVNPDNEKEWEALQDERERFLRWKAGVDKAAATPENQARLVELRKEYPILEKLFETRLYTYANLLEGTPDPKEFGFRDANQASNSNFSQYPRKYEYFKHYIGLPHRDRGTYLKLAFGTGRIEISPKKKLAPGTYALRIRAGTVEGVPEFRRFIEIGYPQRLINFKMGLEGPPISSHQITGTIDHPEIVETRLEVGIHAPGDFAIQERQPAERKSLWEAHFAAKRENGYGHPPSIWIDWIELEGPLPETEAPSPIGGIFDKHLDASAKSETERARAILVEFADAALRRAKPDPKFIDQLLAIFEGRRKQGEAFDVAIRTPLSVILASPGFLYLNEPGEEDAPRSLNDRELAVRLAYFLWSSPPDEELLELAEGNKLHKSKILGQQVDRMIADPRSAEFVSGFVHQWLDMERLDFFQFDVKLHREFDESTRAAAREEVYQSFDYLLRDSKNGRLGDLLSGDYVIINGLLANYYGIDGVTGDAFRKVSLPADSPRGGLLGMAAIHAMGSDGVNSSPVERGAWVLRHVLNNPPPPAPPNVPQISRLDDQVLTTRERLSAHMEEAQCANCHRKIDPIGFGMENFNAAGKWRATDHDGAGKNKKTWKIDASGEFYNGPAFGDYHEMRELIAKREGDFARGFTEHLIEYALGRPFGFADEEFANEIAGSAKSEQYALRAFVHALVQSEAFNKK